MNENYKEETEDIKPRARKALIIEWPDQRTVFEKNKGSIPIAGTVAGPQFRGPVYKLSRRF